MYQLHVHCMSFLNEYRFLFWYKCTCTNVQQNVHVHACRLMDLNLYCSPNYIYVLTHAIFELGSIKFVASVKNTFCLHAYSYRVLAWAVSHLGFLIDSRTHNLVEF